MTVKHTSGPWAPDRTENGFDIWAPERPGRETGERILVAQIGDDDDPRMRVTEPEANAKLIAAAPALADALEGLLALIDGMRESGVPLIAGVDAAARAALRAAGRLP